MISFINENGEWAVWCKECHRQHVLPTPLVYPMTHDEVLIRERVKTELERLAR